MVAVAYRELTQYFPRPGWVEHDAGEIWEAVRATLAELGATLAGRGATVAAIGITNQRETLVAFDRAHGPPLHRAIVWQDRRTAALCAELTEAGHLPWCAPPPASSSIRISAPPRPPGSCATASSRSGPATRTFPSAPSTVGCCGTSPAAYAAASTPPTRPTPAAPSCSIRPPAPGRPRSVRPLRCARGHTARGAPLGRPLRHGCAGRPGAGVGRARRGARVRRPGRPAGGALRAGLLRARHGQGHLRHRQLRPGQRRARPSRRARRPHRQLRLGPRRPRRPPRTVPWPTRSRDRRSCPAPPSSGCATGSASSSRPPTSGRWRRPCPTAVA